MRGGWWVGGFRALKSAFPKKVGFGVYSNLQKVAFMKGAVLVKMPQVVLFLKQACTVLVGYLHWYRGTIFAVGN